MCFPWRLWTSTRPKGRGDRLCNLQRERTWPGEWWSSLICGWFWMPPLVFWHNGHTGIIMYISCIYHVYIMYISCIYHVYIMYISCIYHVYIMYISCIYHVHIMYISCIYHVYIMYISCIYHVYIMYISCIYHVYIMYISCIYHVLSQHGQRYVSATDIFWHLTSSDHDMLWFSPQTSFSTSEVISMWDGEQGGLPEIGLCDRIYAPRTNNSNGILKGSKSDDLDFVHGILKGYNSGY